VQQQRALRHCDHNALVGAAPQRRLHVRQAAAEARAALPGDARPNTARSHSERRHALEHEQRFASSSIGTHARENPKPHLCIYFKAELKTDDSCNESYVR
jgi:hypothetical protein